MSEPLESSSSSSDLSPSEEPLRPLKRSRYGGGSVKKYKKRTMKRKNNSKKKKK
jgi:hypothetical protein